jgi:hypothetical protein
MLSFIATSGFSFAVYLLLTAGSGDCAADSGPARIWGSAFSCPSIVGWVARPFFCDPKRRSRP